MKKLLLSFVCLICILFVGCSPYGEKISYNHLDIYYKDGVTKEEASRAGDYIIHSGMITDLNEKKTIQLKKDGSTYVVSLVANEKTSNADLTNAVLYNTVLLSENVFNNADVRTDLCDDHLKAFQSVKMTDWQALSGSEYEIKFPLSWKAVEHADEDAKFIIYPKSPENAYYIASITLTVGQITPGQQIDEITRALTDRYKDPSYLVNGNIIELSDEVSNGHNGKKMVVTGTLAADNTDKKIEDHYWIANGKLYVLHGYANVNQTDPNAWEDIQAIMKTFKLS